MKKVVIILLLVLPFILIYFISVTGRILEKYSHIYVESLTVEDLEGNDITMKNYVEVRVGSSQKFNIVVGPELASNPSVTVNSYNNEICSFTVTDNIIEVTGIKYGQTTIVVTSVDKTNIFTTFKVRIVDDVPTGLEFAHTTLNLLPGQLTYITPPTFIPSTTKIEYKGLKWETSDESIVKIEDDDSGRVRALKEGQAVITARSTFNNEIYATITVIVSNQKFTDVYFDHYTTGAYIVSESELNLHSIVKYSESFKEQYTDEEIINQYIFKIETNSSGVDVSRLNEGLIIFDSNSSNIMIKIGIYMKNDQDTQVDLITIVFKK